MSPRLISTPCWYALALVLAGACVRAGPGSPATADPRPVVDELLAVDRRFASAARTDGIAALSEMLAGDVTMPTRGGFARDRRTAVAALRDVLGVATSSIDWTPVRGGISADARHGFTYGYMTATEAGGSSAVLKYLAYWVRRPVGWRVVAYKVVRRPPGPVSVTMMAPALPPRLIAPTSDRAVLAQYKQSLIAAERAFSDRAQQVGLGRAFGEMGSVDAMNMGGETSASFVIGPAEIGRAVSGGATGPSTLSWRADRAIVASSGDFGVTFGMVRPNTAPPDAARQAGFPFFTIWRRSSPGDSWRYVAE